MPTYTGNEEHEIDLSTASAWTANFRASVPANTTLGHYFGKGIIQSIIDQDEAVGVRIYFAKDGDGVQQLIITGVDENGDDLYEGLLAEMARRNPPYGVTANPLNS
jgi:hypothetical protein